MKLTEEQAQQARQFIDFLNSKFGKEKPFRLIKEADEYSFAFILPEFGVGVKVKGPPGKKE